MSPRPAKMTLHKSSTEHDHPLKPHQERPTQDEPDFESPAEAAPPLAQEYLAAGILNEAFPIPKGPDRFGAHIPKANPSPHVQAKRFETAYGLGTSSSALIDAEDVSDYTRNLLSLQLRHGDTVYYERQDAEQTIEILVLRPRGMNPVYPEHYQRRRQIGDGYLVKQHIQVFEEGIVLQLPIHLASCCGEHDSASRPTTPVEQLDDLAGELFEYPSRLTAREKVDGVLADFLRKAKSRALRFQRFVNRIDEGDEEAIKEMEERYDSRVEMLEKQRLWYGYQAYAREHSAGDSAPDLEDLFPTPKRPKQRVVDLNKPLPALPIDQDSRHDSVLDRAMT